MCNIIAQQVTGTTSLFLFEIRSAWLMFPTTVNDSFSEMNDNTNNMHESYAS